MSKNDLGIQMQSQGVQNSQTSKYSFQSESAQVSQNIAPAKSISFGNTSHVQGNMYGFSS